MIANRHTVVLTVGYCLISALFGSDVAIAETRVSAQEAGARYGQALGAIEVCDGAKLTDKAKNLKASFAGPDLDKFTSQAAKVYEAWATVKHCVLPRDPNPCRIIIEKSCSAAISEIGPAGSSVPGLIAVKDR